MVFGHVSAYCNQVCVRVFVHTKGGTKMATVTCVYHPSYGQSQPPTSSSISSSSISRSSSSYALNIGSGPSRFASHFGGILQPSSLQKIGIITHSNARGIRQGQMTSQKGRVPLAHCIYPHNKGFPNVIFVDCAADSAIDEDNMGKPPGFLCAGQTQKAGSIVNRCRGWLGISHPSDYYTSFSPSPSILPM